jgi:hypothetical protein
MLNTTKISQAEWPRCQARRPRVCRAPGSHPGGSYAVYEDMNKRASSNSTARLHHPAPDFIARDVAFSRRHGLGSGVDRGARQSRPTINRHPTWKPTGLGPDACVPSKRLERRRIDSDAPRLGRLGSRALGPTRLWQYRLGRTSTRTQTNRTRLRPTRTPTLAAQRTAAPNARLSRKSQEAREFK